MPRPYFGWGCLIMGIQNKKGISFWVIDKVWSRVLLGLLFWPMSLFMVLVTMDDLIFLVFSILFFLGTTFKFFNTTKLKLFYTPVKGVVLKTVTGVFGIPIFSTSEVVGNPNRVLLASGKVTKQKTVGARAVTTYSSTELLHRVYFKFSTKRKSVLIHESTDYKKIEGLAVEVSRWVDVPISKVDRT